MMKRKLISIAKNYVYCLTGEILYVLYWRYFQGVSIEIPFWIWAIVTPIFGVLYSYMDDLIDVKMGKIDPRTVVRIEYILTTHLRLDYFNRAVGNYRKIGIHLLPLQVFITFYRD